MTNNTTSGTFCRNTTIFNRAILDCNITINSAIILVVIARCPSNQSANTCITCAHNSRVRQVTIDKLDFRHGINTFDKCAQSLVLSRVVDVHLVKRQIVNNNARSTSESTAKQCIIQACNGMSITIDDNYARATVTINGYRRPSFPFFESDIIIDCHNAIARASISKRC